MIFALRVKMRAQQDLKSSLRDVYGSAGTGQALGQHNTSTSSDPPRLAQKTQLIRKVVFWISGPTLTLASQLTNHTGAHSRARPGALGAKTGIAFRLAQGQSETFASGHAATVVLFRLIAQVCTGQQLVKCAPEVQTVSLESVGKNAGTHNTLRET